MGGSSARGSPAVRRSSGNSYGSVWVRAKKGNPRESPRVGIFGTATETVKAKAGKETGRAKAAKTNVVKKREAASTLSTLSCGTILTRRLASKELLLGIMAETCIIFRTNI